MTTITKISSFVLLTQYLVCGSFIPSAGLLGNYVGGLSGGRAIKALQARDYTGDTSSGEEYANEHYDHEEEHESEEKNLDDEHFTGKHELTEEIQDNKDHSDFSHEHESDYHQEPEQHHENEHYEQEDHDSHEIPDHQYEHEDSKSAEFEPKISKVFPHPALEFDTSDSVKKIYHGKGGFSYSTLYDNL